MSKESWREEFYPKPANETTKEEAASHSLRKWIGLRKENRDKHEVGKYPIPLDWSTCALCYHYIESSGGCPNCPLNQLLGTTCDDNYLDTSPYHHYTFMHTNPEPMIKALQAIVDKEKASGKLPPV